MALYLLRSVVKSIGIVASNQEDGISMLWHNRLGHIILKVLGYFFKYSGIRDKPLGNLKFCEQYILGKQTRVKFSKCSHTSNHNLEYFHSNLCSFTFIQSLGGSRYFISFINDHSRKV